MLYFGGLPLCTQLYKENKETAVITDAITMIKVLTKILAVGWEESSNHNQWALIKNSVRGMMDWEDLSIF